MSQQSHLTLPDADARKQALEIHQSCIVQAPAGSGKTELLTLRYLRLLSVSNQPEEVLAITFTRKAASEMRDRILSTLAWAEEIDSSGAVLELEFEKQRLAIARAVIAHDKACNWSLLKNPSRLRVQTIDSFCFYLANQLPVLSQVGGNPVLSEDVNHIYNHAINNTLAELDRGTNISDDIARLLKHLDNNVGRAEKLLSDLLNRRDQWVSHVLFVKNSATDAQEYLVGNLLELVHESLNQLHIQLVPVADELSQLLRFAGHNRRQESGLWQALENLELLPGDEIDDLPYWQALANLLLTQDGKWRSRVDKRQGFPAGDKEDKAFDALCKQRKLQFNELISSLKEQAEIREALDYCRKLPDPEIDSDQWLFLSSLTRILIHLSGQLLLSFSQFGMMDYAQAGSAARNALGSEGSPTDLALSLDHSIKHILVDEFQDTSQLQLEILQQLTAGWQQEDERSLFLVGDAMQSCYGFRNANVGIYLHAREHGIGEIKLNSLTLQTNFRSQEKVVDWVNRTFSSAFPSVANSSRGAVPYSSSIPLKAPEENFEVNARVIQHQADYKKAAQLEEAEQVIAHIRSLQNSDPDSSIAVLVRGRSHLDQIIPLLKQEQIPWLATDIDRLGTLPIIEDLLSLTRGILNQADRVAWLAILRAPWCGLHSNDLLSVANYGDNISIWSVIEKIVNDSGSEISTLELSSDGLQRIKGIGKPLQMAMSIRYRTSLRNTIEATWTLLRGSSLLKTDDDHNSIAHYFKLLEQQEFGNGLLNIDEFERKVSQSFISAATDSTSGNPVNILTMHKAKGLEFDHIILPGLSRTPASDGKQLLQWYERLNSQGENRLFLTTQAATGSKENKLYDLMRYEQQQKNRLEDTRLLYIAVTRAKVSALLLATVSEDSKGSYDPPHSSLLYRIWPQLNKGNSNLECIQLSEEKTLRFSQTGNANGKHMPFFPDITPVTRASKALTLSPEENSLIQQTIDTCNIIDSDTEVSAHYIETEFDTTLAASIGTLIHSCLESYTRSKQKTAWLNNLENQKNYWRLKLRQHIDSEPELEATVTRIEKTLQSNLSNSQLSWIFTDSNGSAESELGLSNRFNRQFVIDRTLIDDEGVRWIIDFKTGSPAASQSKTEFITRMTERYQGQLENYGKLFSDIEDRPTKLALYLTSIEELVIVESS